MTLNFAGNPALAPFIFLKQKKKTFNVHKFYNSTKRQLLERDFYMTQERRLPPIALPALFRDTLEFLKMCSQSNSLGFGSFKDIRGVWRGYRPMLCFMSFLCLMQLLESRFPAVPFIVCFPPSTFPSQTDLFRWNI